MTSTLPAAGAWLVTSDGAELETQGPWEVRGRLVVFHQPNGTLSSLPVGDVDLEGSRELTAAKAAAAAPAPPPPREAVWTLGPGDVTRVRPTRPPAEPEAAAASDETADLTEIPGDAPERPLSFYDQLEVSSWEKGERTYLDGVEVTGRLANHNENTALDVALTVTLYDDAGQQLGSAAAFLDSPSLLGRTTMGFRVLFEGVRDFADATFDIRATEVELGVGDIDGFVTESDEETSDS